MKPSHLHRIPFGVRDGRMVAIEDVESGLACKCNCPSCGRPLLAKKGNIREHHFSHESIDEARPCLNAVETSIHLMAKQIIATHRSVTVPELTVRRTSKDLDGNEYSASETIETERMIIFESVDQEVRLEGIRPDLVGNANGQLLAIEVAVTHHCDSAKAKKLQLAELATVEIDLSGVKIPISEETLTTLIISSAENRKWLFNPFVAASERMLDQTLRRTVAEENRKIAQRNAAQIRPKEPANDMTSASSGSIKGNQVRWFLCENCRGVFSKPSVAVLDFTEFVTCIVCGFDVSAKLL